MLKKKNRLIRMLCGSLAAVFLIGASIAYAQESDEIEDAAEQTTVEEIQEPVSKPENTDVSSGEDDPEPEPEPDPEPEPEPELDPDPDPIPDPDPEPEPQTPTLELSVADRSTVSLEVGKTKKIYATVTPEGTEVDWESSDEAVASVAVSNNTLQATITAAKAGTAKITAEAEGVKPMSFYVYVKGQENPNPDPNPNPNPTPIGGRSTGLGVPATSLPTATYKMPDHIPQNVSLTVDSNLGTSTDKILDALYSYDCYATFFVDPAKIYEKDNRVRRIVGQGHSVGLQLPAKQAQRASAALAVLSDANDELTTVCGVPTRLVAVEGGSGNLPKKVYKALKKAGYRIWDWDYTTGTDFSDSKKAAEALEEKMDTKGTLVVRMTSDKKTANMLTETLGYMSYVQIPTRALTSSDTPVCFADK